MREEGIITAKNFGALIVLYSEIGGACVDTVFWARVQDGRIKWQYAVYKMSYR